VRQSETQFNVEVLGSVQFASLLEPSPVPTCLQTPRSSISGSGVSHTSSLASSSPAQASANAPLPFTPPPRRSLPVRRNSDGSSSSASSPPTEDAPASGEGPQALGLLGVPFTFSLWEQPWTPERCWVYPKSYRQTVAMSLLSRPKDLALPCIPDELWVKHIFPWCPRWWFETAVVSTPGLAPHRAPALSVDLTALTPACKAGEDSDSAEGDDDGRSTRAPSSGISSANTTPETGPSQPPLGELSPGDVEMDMGVGAAPTQDSADASSGLLFEVFGDGHRHAIGAGEDPDDMEPDAGLHTVVPLRVLELLAEDARRRRRRREDDDDAPDSEAEAEEEVVMAEADLVSGEDDDDEVMVDVEDIDADVNGEVGRDAPMP